MNPLKYFSYLPLISLLWLSSCQLSSNSQSPKNSELSLPSYSDKRYKEDQSLTFNCLSQLPNDFPIKFSNYEAAQKSDFVQSIRNYAKANPTQRLTCSILESDFNQDQFHDYALLLIANDQTHFRFLVLLNQGNGQFSEAVVNDFPMTTDSSQGVVYTSMSYKSPGDLGILTRAYSPIKRNTPEAEMFIASAAIELWDAIKDNQTNRPMNLEVSTLAYCSKVFYWPKSELETVTVCD